MTSTESSSSTSQQFFNFTILSTVPVQYRFIPGSVTDEDLNSTTSTNLTSTTTSATISVNTTVSASRQPLSNGTGYYIEEESEGGLSELQTLFLACIATFLPLIVSLFAAFGIRVLWRKYRSYRGCNNFDNYDGGVLKKEDQSEGTIPSVSSHCQQMKCSETQISIADDDVESYSNTPISTITNGPQSLRTSNNHPTNTNGSIITMTLKNNHLIVETEERNDIREDSRETKMTYSPSARDGVFVVEVQQGSKRSPGSCGPSSCIEAIPSASTSDQCALVHNPPDRYSDDETLEEYDEAEYYVETSSPATNGTETISSLRCQSQAGLSQSDRSISSTTQTYTYGNQQGYCTGSFGYPVYNGYKDENEHVLPKIKRDPHKPRIISEIYKSNSFVKASFDTLDEIGCHNNRQIVDMNIERSKRSSIRPTNQLGTLSTQRMDSIMFDEETEKRLEEEQKHVKDTKTTTSTAAKDAVQYEVNQQNYHHLANNANGLESCQNIEEEISIERNIGMVAKNELGVAEVV